MIVQITIDMKDSEPTEDNIRDSFDRLMAAKWMNEVNEGGHFCKVFGEDGELESWLALQAGWGAQQQFLKTAVLRTTYNNNKQQTEGEQI